MICFLAILPALRVALLYIIRAGPKLPPARTIIDAVLRRELPEPQIAEQLGIAQSRVSDLVRGKWEKFSLEMLIILEARAARQVTLELVV